MRGVPGDALTTKAGASGETRVLSFLPMSTRSPDAIARCVATPRAAELDVLL
ncbi:hypothetical protein BURPS668_A2217 [Burkholderia pseudomallei 668]|nr:hypothetical protein BURPS668_A2217 [Burkholderia pseudomallei 668]